MEKIVNPKILVLIAWLFLFSAHPTFLQEKPEYPKLRDSLMQAELTTVDGNRFSLHDLKGKVVLINLWAVWCGPCRMEMPVLSETQRQYSRESFEIIGLNVGDANGEPEAVRSTKLFAGQVNVTYTLATSSIDTVKEFYSITKQFVVPQTILIDREGYLRGIFIGAGPRVRESLRATVEVVVKEK